ncbi:hypothetical protein [Helicobacter labetoulli]|uniref:hypothetical protein n=1 Tax=Helicobacter labetoulli TaxID=2315333 RepID=UPI000EF6CC46|nr:hypothetical protein [Helicobacter labetoulli]
MALTPIGNVTYINQNSQVGSMQHANAMQKVDFALNANMQEFVDKLKAVQEVAPAQETKAIDPDDKQEKKNEQEAHNDSAQPSEEESLAVVEDESIACVSDEVHLLDIRA